MNSLKKMFAETFSFARDQWLLAQQKGDSAEIVLHVSASC